MYQVTTDDCGGRSMLAGQDQVCIASETVEQIRLPKFYPGQRRQCAGGLCSSLNNECAQATDISMRAEVLYWSMSWTI